MCIDTQDREGLHDWIKAYFGLDIPTVKICPDHCAPFDFVADYIFGMYDFMVVVANRSGGKTLNFGMLDALMAWFQSSTEIATVGAIQFQAQKAYEYFKEFSSKDPFASNLISLTMGKTTMHNKSEVKVLTGTMSGVNSPHPQLVFLDEIDLMLWQVLQQALSMAQSKGKVRARTVLTSTRKFAGGPMQRLLDEAEEKHAKVYMWCIWEVVEALPTDQPLLMEEIRQTFGAALPANIGLANGYYSWRDAVTKFNILDEDTWATEWICSRPGLQGVVYGSSYSDDNNMIVQPWTPVGRGGYVYLAEDFGYGEGHDDVCLFIWIPVEFDRMVVFDELYMKGMGDQEIWDAIDLKLQEYGHRLPNQEHNIQGTIQGWVPDPHNLTAIANRKFRGAPMMEKDPEAKNYIILNGIAMVQKLFQSGRLMYTSKVINLRTETLSYKKKKNLDGTFSKDPEKKMDNGPDTLRYFVVKFYWQLMANIAKPQKTNPDVSSRFVAQPPRNPDLPLPADQQSSGEKPITAGLMSGEVVF